MSRLKQLKILFCVTIFFGLCNAIVKNEDILKNMSPEDIKSFFGTEDGSVPEFEVVELIQPPRSKRATQAPLKITFNYFGASTTAILNVVEDHELVSPSTTGIWFAEYKAFAHQNIAYTPQPDIFDRIGNVDFFQNVIDCSAITRFWNSAGQITMSGVLKQDYGVRSVPMRDGEGYYHVSDKHTVKRRSTNSTEKADENSSVLLVIYKLPEVPLEYFQHRTGTQNSSLPDLDLHRKRRQNFGNFIPPSIVYPKLLISPDYKVISREKSVEESVQELIAHLNAVDMIYRQIPDPVVRLKIGGIIIPRDEHATPYIAQNTLTVTDINADNVLASAKTHFNNENNRLQFNTFTAVIMMTMGSLFSIDLSGDVKLLAGLAMTGSACRAGRAIVGHSKGFHGVLATAHELGHVFIAQHDDGFIVPCKSNEGFIMVPDGNLGRRLKWSSCSLRSFSWFLSSQQTSCMHSRPEELPDAVKHMQGAWLSINGQCDNIIEDSNGVCFDSLDTCTNFGCSKKSVCYWRNRSPMEGSLAGRIKVIKERSQKYAGTLHQPKHAKHSQTPIKRALYKSAVGVHIEHDAKFIFSGANTSRKKAVNPILSIQLKTERIS